MYKKEKDNNFRMVQGLFQDELIPYKIAHPELTDKQVENFHSLGLCIDDLYVNPTNFIYPNVYLGKGFKSFILVIDGLFNFSKEEIENCNPMDDMKNLCAKQFLFQRERFDEAVEEKNWGRAMRILDKPFRIDFFLETFSGIPKNTIRELFIEMYSQTEYGFEKLLPILKDVLKERSQMTKEERNTFYTGIDKFDSLKIIDGQEYVRIFRGEASKSNKIDEAFSWSLDYDTANYFAHRFDSDGIIHEGLILKEDILAYINSRSEYEVIVDFNDVILKI